MPASELLRKPAPTTGPRFSISVALGPMRGQRYRLAPTGGLVGRTHGAVLFPEDRTVSAHHATFLVKNGRLVIRDEGALSGVFVNIASQESLPNQGFFAAGQRLFRYLGVQPAGTAPAPGVPLVYGAPVATRGALMGLEEVLVGGRPGRSVLSVGPILAVGQTQCDLSYPGEEGMAPRHCEVIPTPAGATLKDLSSGLGTFIRIATGVERPLDPGDRVRIGAQVLVVEAAL